MTRRKVTVLAGPYPNIYECEFVDITDGMVILGGGVRDCTPGTDVNEPICSKLLISLGRIDAIRIDEPEEVANDPAVDS
jgi:hypothetical protein